MIAKKADPKYPIIVELTSPGGASLYIGVGGEQSWLHYQSHPAGPYYESFGEAGATEETVFFLDGHPIEAPGATLISRRLAREAACLFVETGGRPDNVHWREV